MPSNVSRRRVGIFVLACLGLLALVVLVVGGISPALIHRRGRSLAIRMG